MKALQGFAGFLLSMLCAAVVAQQPYPGKPVRLLIPFPPGEGTDVTQRNMAQNLSARLGQPVVVENRAGGNFVIAAQACTSTA